MKTFVSERKIIPRRRNSSDGAAGLAQRRSQAMADGGERDALGGPIRNERASERRSQREPESEREARKRETQGRQLASPGTSISNSRRRRLGEEEGGIRISSSSSSSSSASLTALPRSLPLFLFYPLSFASPNVFSPLLPYPILPLLLLLLLLHVYVCFLPSSRRSCCSPPNRTSRLLFAALCILLRHDVHRRSTPVPLHAASVQGAARAQLAVGVQRGGAHRAVQALRQGGQHQGQCRGQPQPGVRGVREYSSYPSALGFVSCCGAC